MEEDDELRGAAGDVNAAFARDLAPSLTSSLKSVKSRRTSRLSRPVMN